MDSTRRVPSVSRCAKRRRNCAGQVAEVSSCAGVWRAFMGGGVPEPGMYQAGYFTLDARRWNRRAGGINSDTLLIRLSANPRLVPGTALRRRFVHAMADKPALVNMRRAFEIRVERPARDILDFKLFADFCIQLKLAFVVGKNQQPVARQNLHRVIDQCDM